VDTSKGRAKTAEGCYPLYTFKRDLFYKTKSDAHAEEIQAEEKYECSNAFSATSQPDGSCVKCPVFVEIKVSGGNHFNFALACIGYFVLSF
jgi:hypothetical protein